MLFVAHRDDIVAQRALCILCGMGYQTQCIVSEDSVPASAIGLFGSSGKFRNQHLRLSAHSLREEGFELPAWASSLVFLVAVNNKARGGTYHTTNFRDALKMMAEYYASWNPYMRKPDAPWIPHWHRGAPHEAFPVWKARARRAVGEMSVYDRLSYQLSPIFCVKSDIHIDRVLITGCALFNKPHTDVVDTIPRGKRDEIVRILASILHDSGLQKAEFIVPGPDLLDARLRQHFHPFVFESIASVEKHLGPSVGNSLRLYGHTHARSDEEICRALEASATCIRTEIIQATSQISGVSIQACSWTECVGPYLDRAYALACKYQKVAEQIYDARVRTRPSYASLHAIDPARGLERTIANNVLYIAEAYCLRDNPTTAIVNCEFGDTFWKGLEAVLALEIWGDWRPFIGMVDSAARQPWGY